MGDPGLNKLKQGYVISLNKPNDSNLPRVEYSAGVVKTEPLKLAFMCNAPDVGLPEKLGKTAVLCCFENDLQEAHLWLWVSKWVY